MLNKEQLNKKLQEKRNKEIATEYKRLEELEINHKNEILEIEEKIFTVGEEKKKLDEMEVNLNQELENIKNSDISTTIDKLNNDIVLLKDNIKEQKNSVKIAEDEHKKNNENILYDLDVNLNNFKDLEKNFFLKEKQINLLIVRKKRLDNECNEYLGNIKDIDSKIKKIKLEIADRNVENMLQRFEVIEENIYNLKLKKKIKKDKMELNIRIKQEEDKLIQLPLERENELRKIYDDYDQIINDVDVDILNEMNKLEENVNNFNLETQKQIFFQTNLVKNLKNKLDNLENFYLFKSQCQKKEIDTKNKIRNDEINNLKKNKNEITKKINSLKVDINFLENSYVEQSKVIEVKRKNEEENHHNYVKMKKIKLKMNNENLKKFKQKIDVKISKLNEEISDNYKYISLLKKQYYDSIKTNQDKINKVKIDSKFLVNKKKEYELIISNKRVEYKKYLKEKNDRITYLEKQNLKLSLIENKN